MTLAGVGSFLTVPTVLARWSRAEGRAVDAPGSVTPPPDEAPDR